MNLIFEERPSDSPFVETVWRTHSESAGSFTSRATSHGEMVVMRHKGKTIPTVRGPEMTATLADFPADAEWLGITFKLGIYMPHLPPRILRDRRDATLPEATSKSFWMALLEQSLSIPDTVGQAGYVDQPHLTRSLKHFMGVTPAQMTRLSRPE